MTPLLETQAVSLVACRTKSRVWPSKYDARPVAPIPYTGSLGDLDESMYTVSEASSTGTNSVVRSLIAFLS